jgi:3-hydroxyisobutyrate dehydrogenase-like beta-hydroxyacid dehydrogenase
VLASKTNRRSRAKLEGVVEPGLERPGQFHSDPEEAGMDVAVLGMGRMGRAVAGRLLEGGHRVAVWNRSKRKAAEIVSAGGREAHSVANAVDGVDVAITMLANDYAVRAVAFGELRSSIADQTVYADCSTVSPNLSGELAEAFPARFLALPVLGSPVAVRAGQAVYLAGGDARLVDRLGPLLASLSNTVRRYDSAPLAITAKLATNLLLLAEVIALAESFAVGRCGGLTDDQLRELLGASPMVAPGLKNRFEGVLTGSQEGWWSTGLGAKDAGLAIDIAKAAEVELPGAAVVQRLYEKAATTGLDQADIAAVTKLYRGQEQS